MASHLALGAEDGRAEAIDWLRRAASEASSRSPRVAVELVDRAVELSGAGQPAREEMLADRAVALIWAGRTDEALRAARDMLAASIGAPLEGRLRYGLAQALLVEGRWREAAEELEILATRPGWSGAEAARQLGDTDRFDEALAVLHRGRRHSEEAGAYWQLPLYDDGIGTLHFHAGRWDDAGAEIETCMALAEETGTLWWLVPASCMLAYIAIHQDQDDLADELLTTARRQAASSDFGSNRLLWVTALRQEAMGDVAGAMATL